MIKCILENGHQTSFRHITVGSIAINEKKEVLLVRRAENIHSGGKFTIPGGFLDRDENTEAGALRELKEETGYDGKIEFLFQINDSPKRPKEDRQNIDFIFIAKVIGGEMALNSEVSNIYWFAKDNLPQEEDFAFDHRSIILHYFEYLEKPFPLPIIGRANL
jgi:ADP-ribose pyrophosphatase YjhB (NUDIX family)